MITKTFKLKLPSILKRRSITMTTLVVALLTLIIVIISLSIKAYAQNKGVEVPIIMYHSILKDESKSNDYVITPVELERDLIYLKENGYNTIFVDDLIDYVYDNVPLPENPVILTFDDGSYNNLVYALPLLEKYDMKAVWSIVGSYTDKEMNEENRSAAYSFLTWDEIKSAYESGRVQIANHSYDLHTDGSRKGSKKMPNETFEEYQSILIADLCNVQNSLEKIGIRASTYTYPYGFISDESLDIVKNIGFKASLSCYEKKNFITKEDSLYQLGRYNRSSAYSTKEFMKKALK